MAVIKILSFYRVEMRSKNPSISQVWGNTKQNIVTTPVAALQCKEQHMLEKIFQIEKKCRSVRKTAVNPLPPVQLNAPYFNSKTRKILANMLSFKTLFTKSHRFSLLQISLQSPRFIFGFKGGWVNFVGFD